MAGGRRHGPLTARGPEFEFYGQALQAAVDGLGIAMGIRPYIDDDLAPAGWSRRFALSVPKGMRWYLVYRGFSTGQRDLPRSGAGLSARRQNPPCAAGARNMPDETIDTLVIGGGQAGLVMSHRLKERGLSHLVLERHRIAERWRSERWDGLKFQFPNWSVRLPDFPFPHSDPDAFASDRRHHQIHRGLCRLCRPPIRCGVAVTRLSQRDGAGLHRRRPRTARSRRTMSSSPPVPISATSSRTCCAIIPCSRSMPPTTRIPDSFRRARCWSPAPARPARRSPRNCCRPAAASTSRSDGTGRLPRRYRGRDLIWWLAEMNLDQVTPEERGPARLGPVISGAYGGRTIDFRNFAADGMILVGRIEAAHRGVLEIAPALPKAWPTATSSTPPSSIRWTPM
jgi:putative flavoprotein involved in K+ transport